MSNYTDVQTTGDVSIRQVHQEVHVSVVDSSTNYYAAGYRPPPPPLKADNVIMGGATALALVAGAGYGVYWVASGALSASATLLAGLWGGIMGLGAGIGAGLGVLLTGASQALLSITVAAGLIGAAGIAVYLVADTVRLVTAHRALRQAHRPMLPVPELVEGPVVHLLPDKQMVDTVEYGEREYARKVV